MRERERERGKRGERERDVKQREIVYAIKRAHEKLDNEKIIQVALYINFF